MRSTSILALALAAPAAIAAAPVASASTPTHTYQHGLYAQSHATTQADCQGLLNNAASTLKRYGATNLNPAPCHPINALASNGTSETGWVYDITYKRPTRPLYFGDIDLGTSPGPLAGAHSYRITGSYTNKADATNVEAARVNTLNSSPTYQETWRSGITQNAITKAWVYEVDYTARTPMYYGHTEISEKPGVTTPSLGITQVAPSAPTATATGQGVTAPGTAGMGSTSTGSTTTVTPPSTPVVPKTVGSVAGIDISNWTKVNDWAGWKAKGVQFLWAKASEGTYYTNSQFPAQSAGAAANGITYGAYHFAIPSLTTGAEQADFFINNGGGWKPNSNMLPGAVDMEWNPYGGTNSCYGLSQSQMSTWVRSFMAEYKARTGVNPIIYTARSWWNQCVGSSSFADAPLWLANYSSTPGLMPAGWSGTAQSVWQNSDGTGGGYDTDVWNGDVDSLQRYANTGAQ